MSKIINSTDKASLWEIIGFPCGVLFGIILSIVLTILYKGKECIA